MNAPTIAQRSPEWHQQRQHKVTGSRAGAILGVSPFSTPADCMKEMLGLTKFEGNVATEYGNFHEGYAIADLEIDHRVKVVETGFHVHPDLGWLGASPDGFINDDIVIEVKCPYGKRNDEEPVFKTAIEQEHYYAQMQIEMFCTGRNTCWFYQWTKNGNSLEIVNIDIEWIQQNIPTLREFHQAYMLQTVSDDDAIVESYEMAKEALNEAKAEMAETQQAVIDRAKDMNSPVVGRLKVTQVERKGSIDYAKIPILDGFDLEPYRKAGSTFWKVS